jgi:hypothetical protein
MSALPFLYMCRVLCAVLGGVFLSGCVIESSKALHSEADKIPIHAVMVGQKATFRSKAGDYIFLRRVQGRLTVALTNFSGAIGKSKSLDMSLYQFEGLPRSVYVAARTVDGRHEYVPFHYDRSGILVLLPRRRIKVSSLDAFTQALLDVPGTPVFYERLSGAEGEKAYRKYVTREVRRKKQATLRQHEYVNPYRVFDTGIDRLAKGDRVYWLRAQSTEVMVVDKILISSGYVMVHRETDHAAAKVHHSQLMTQRQASKNGIKHGVATTRSAFCLAQPKECHW